MHENKRLVNEMKGHFNSRTAELQYRNQDRSGQKDSSNRKAATYQAKNLYGTTPHQVTFDQKIDEWLRDDSKREDPEHHSRYYTILSKLDMQNVINSWKSQ